MGPGAMSAILRLNRPPPDAGLPLGVGNGTQAAAVEGGGVGVVGADAGPQPCGPRMPCLDVDALVSVEGLGLNCQHRYRLVGGVVMAKDGKRGGEVGGGLHGVWREDGRRAVLLCGGV